MPVAPATASGVKSFASVRSASVPRTSGSSRPRATSPSSNSTCTSANRKKASPPGLMKTCSSAISAVSLRRGSTTTIRPPRSRIRRRRPGRVRGRHQAAVRSQRVGAQHQQILRAVEIRNRNREHAAEDRRAGEHLGELIDARRRKASLAAQRAQQRRKVERGAEIVGVGVADVGRQRLGAMRVAHPAQALGRERERLLPADLLPAGGGPADRPAQPVRILLEGLEPIGLGAEIARG